MEVPTNAAGQASVEIFQKAPAHGTNRVCIQVIRPADTPGAGGKKLVVDSGSTTKSWTAPDLAVCAAAPATANVGATLGYRITISNPGDLPARDVVATDAVPDGLSYLGGNPPAETAGRQLRWQIGELGARQQRVIDVNFRAERAGGVSNCCEATATGGLKATACAATTIISPGAPLPTSPPSGSPSIDIRITGPAQDTVAVGSRITFQVAVTNRGQSAATRLRIKDRFDPGLEHKDAEGKNVIDRPLDDIAAGATRRLAVEFRVTQPGRLCHVIEVAAADVVLATSQACIMAVGEAAAPGPGPTQYHAIADWFPADAAFDQSYRPEATRRRRDGAVLCRGDQQGRRALRNVKVADGSDPALDPDLGHRRLPARQRHADVDHRQSAGGQVGSV